MFDGDKVSLNFIWEDNAREELTNKLNSKTFYMSTDNKLVFSAQALTNDIVTSLFTE